MTRYIDADAVIKQLHKIANCYIDNDRMEASSGTVRAMLEVKEAPTVDVVEVVRCKDCKHHKERGWYNICDIHVGNGYPDNWFCADGERRE